MQSVFGHLRGRGWGCLPEKGGSSPPLNQIKSRQGRDQNEPDGEGTCVSGGARKVFPGFVWSKDRDKG
jgi:hypothetical protein